MRITSMAGIALAGLFAFAPFVASPAPSPRAIAAPAASAAAPLPPAGVGWVKIYDGMLPEGTAGGAIEALTVPGGADALVVGGPESISVLRFADRQRWDIVTRVNCKGRKKVAWGAGDVLDNKGGQLVVYADGAISVYDIGASVQVYTHDSPDTMLAMAIGDADADGSNELVSLCAAAGRREGAGCRIVVSRLDETGNAIIWEDRGSLGIARPEEAGCSFALHVVDLFNDGTRRVIVEETQPDVAPARFLVFSWKDGALEKDQTLVFDRVPVSLAECAAGKKSIEYFLMGPIAPRAAGAVQFLGTLVDPSGNGGVFVMKIESLDIAIQEKLIDDWMVGRAGWVNLDGAGPGIVRVWQAPGYPRAQYSFYRKIAGAER